MLHSPTLARLGSLVLACLISAGGAALSFAQPASAPAPSKETKSAPAIVVPIKGLVAADHELASQAGAEMLKQGGNAVDAAVATSFALAVVRPESCGLGGGGFMIVALPDKNAKPGTQAPIKTIAALNYRETCPPGVGPNFFEKLEPSASTIGGKSAAIPGTVAGLLQALEKWGTLDRAKVLAPAIKLAREGFVVDAHYLRAAEKHIAKFKAEPTLQTRFADFWRIYLLKGELKAGDTIKNPEMASALELIAREGAKAFYSGAIAKAIEKSVKADGGAIDVAALGAYKPSQIEALKFTFDSKQFLTMPPPSSGGVALAQIFGIIEQKNFADLVKGENHVAPMQTLVEATKHAFADRAEWLGDPAFVQVPVKKLISREYLAQRAATIKATSTQGPQAYGTSAKPRDDGGTSHLCVIDSRGGAVACTETVNLEFGSCVVVEGFGFLLNNEMDDFTTRPGEANAFGLKQSDKNAPQPGKRPLSSMTPTIVLDAQQRVLAIAGASGGPRIITSTSQVLINALVLGQSAEQAVTTPRFHHQWLPNVLEVEANMPGRHNGLDITTWMRKLHHQVDVVKERRSAAQLIVRTKDGWQAACDPSKGGKPAGE